ncbi:hypothetical protein [Desulfogranum japonicum]|uniref:hypothetical protein n=1 Tax=Desulfogranum japonicum TaxID=231447 RepID=UPI0012946DAE|nr:hypothetical protein [Desulfogranum japonicum]
MIKGKNKLQHKGRRKFQGHGFPEVESLQCGGGARSCRGRGRGGYGRRTPSASDYILAAPNSTDRTGVSNAASSSDVYSGHTGMTEFCPLCKNHCSLSDPGCRKGEAYAVSMSSSQSEV